MIIIKKTKKHKNTKTQNTKRKTTHFAISTNELHAMTRVYTVLRVEAWISFDYHSASLSHTKTHNFTRTSSENRKFLFGVLNTQTLWEMSNTIFSEHNGGFEPLFGINSKNRLTQKITIEAKQRPQKTGLLYIITTKHTKGCLPHTRQQGHDSALLVAYP